MAFASESQQLEGMCNRYALRADGIEADFWASEDAPDPGALFVEAFPDRMAPVVRKRADGRREWVSMRWGLPGPFAYGGAPVTNIRNLASPHWREWLAPAQRCLVPFTLFAEYDDHTPKGAKRLRWFAQPDRGVAMFAGVWRTWRGVRGPKSAPVEGEHLLFSFLTTEANDLIRPIHAKAMPMILTTEAEYAQWLNAPADEVEALQARELAPDMLQSVEDREAEAALPSLTPAPKKQGSLF